MKLKKSKRNNLIFLVLVALLLIPQTRKPIQVFLHKGFALFSPSIDNENNRGKMDFVDWELEDLNGGIINFRDLEGKVVFLNFWATWCPPCIAEMKSIDDLYDDYKDKIQFVVISNESQDKVQAFLNKKGYSLNSYNPQTNYPSNLNINSIPRTFLVSKSGEIVIDKGGAANWNSKQVRTQIEKLLLE